MTEQYPTTTTPVAPISDIDKELLLSRERCRNNRESHPILSSDRKRTISPWSN